MTNAASHYEPDLPDFASRILYIRHLVLRISRVELAERMGLAHATIANWEKGVRPQDPWEVAQAYAKVADTPGLTAWWVFSGSGDLPLIADTPTLIQGKARVRTPTTPAQPLAKSA